MKIFDITTLLLREGGNVFPNTSALLYDDYQATWSAIVNDLKALGCKNIHPIGTTGKKQVMNDLDIAAEFEGGRTACYDAAQRYFGTDIVKSIGSNIVCLNYPIVTSNQDRLGQRVQVDVMIGKSSFLRWGKYGTTPNQKHADYSRIKGAARNILFNCITTALADVHFPHEQSQFNRVRYIIDSDLGMRKMTQTRAPAKPGGPPLKAWKNIDSQFITDDPDQIIKFIFGPHFSAFDITTFEKTLDAMYVSDKIEPYADAILDDFLVKINNEIQTRPGMIFHDVSSPQAIENGMNYLRDLIQSYRGI